MTNPDERNAELGLKEQIYTDDPLETRDTDQYRNEYILRFVDKWDALIDWDARTKSEGNFFHGLLASRGKRTVLDVATGTGFHSVNLREAGFDVTSADGSAAMLARAFENGKNRGLILKTVQADWRWLGQSVHERYDAIICLGNSFTHIHDELDRRRVLAEFYAALEPNGVLILDQRNYDTMLDNGFQSKHKYYYCGDQVSAEPIHIDENLVRFQYSFADGEKFTLNLHPIRKDYTRRLLREAGFERIRTYGDFEVAYDNKNSDFFIHVAEKSAIQSEFPVSLTQSSRARVLAESYYDSDEADKFYTTIWGGEDLHLGIYDDTTDIRQASRETVKRMLGVLPALNQDSKVIDLGSGYGGSARHLVKETGAHVTCLNLSDTQNDHNRLVTQSEGMQNKIDIQHADFEDIPAANDSFDAVWSQDAFLHAAARDRVIAEAFRVLKPGGHMVFTDPMQVDGIDPDLLSEIYSRLALSSLGSVNYYKDLTSKVGFELIDYVDLSKHLPTHYTRIKQELELRRAEVEETANSAFVDTALSGLENWIQGGKKGWLSWGIFLLLKPD